MQVAYISFLCGASFDRWETPLEALVISNLFQIFLVDYFVLICEFEMVRLLDFRGLTQNEFDI